MSWGLDSFDIPIALLLLRHPWPRPMQARIAPQAARISAELLINSSRRTLLKTSPLRSLPLVPPRAVPHATHCYPSKLPTLTMSRDAPTTQAEFTGGPLPYEAPDDLTVAQFFLDTHHPMRSALPHGAPWFIEDGSGHTVGPEEVRSRVHGLANALHAEYGIGKLTRRLSRGSNETDFVMLAEDDVGKSAFSSIVFTFSRAPRSLHCQPKSYRYVLLFIWAFLF